MLSLIHQLQQIQILFNLINTLNQPIMFVDMCYKSLF